MRVLSRNKVAKPLYRRVRTSDSEITELKLDNVAAKRWAKINRV